MAIKTILHLNLSVIKHKSKPCNTQLKLFFEIKNEMIFKANLLFLLIKIVLAYYLRNLMMDKPHKTHTGIQKPKKDQNYKKTLRILLKIDEYAISFQVKHDLTIDSSSNIRFTI